MGDYLSIDKQFKYGICLHNCSVTNNRRLKYKMFQEQPVKVFEINRDGLALSLCNDQHKLFAQISNFDTIEPNLLKYLNAIRDEKERTVFFKDVARREFVLSLTRNMIVNVACPNGQRIKAMFLEVNEKETENKIFITVQLLQKPEEYLIRCFESVSDNYSTEKLQYSLPPNMITKFSFLDVDKQSEKNAIIDKTLWQCLVCHNENFKDTKTCKRCSGRKDDRYTFPKAGLNFSCNYVNNLDDKEIYPPNEIYDKNYEICFKLKGSDDNYQENKHSPENVQNNTNSNTTAIAVKNKRAPQIPIVSGQLKKDEALKSQPFLGRQDETNEPDSNVMLEGSIETPINEWVCVVCCHSNKHDSNGCLNCGEGEVLSEHNSQANVASNVIVPSSSLNETPINPWICDVCYHSNNHNSKACLNCGG